jgi:hypothetical protein
MNVDQGFTDDDLRTYSDELAKLPPPSPAPDAVPAKFEQGRAATRKHRCGFCHNPSPWMREVGFSKTRVEPLAGAESMVVGLKRFRVTPSFA